MTRGSSGFTTCNYQKVRDLVEPSMADIPLLRFSHYTTLKNGVYKLVSDYCIPKSTTMTVQTKMRDSTTVINAPLWFLVVVCLPFDWAKYVLRMPDFFNFVFGKIKWTWRTPFVGAASFRYWTCIMYQQDQLDFLIFGSIIFQSIPWYKDLHTSTVYEAKREHKHFHEFIVEYVP